MDDFLANNVNGLAGDLLICDSYVARMFPEIVAVASKGRKAYYFSPESNHIDQLGFKLTTVLRLGHAKSVSVLTKDGSPHSLQIPLVVQEAALNTDFPSNNIRFFAVEKSVMMEISHRAVRTARHLSEIEAMLSIAKETPKQRTTTKAKEFTQCFAAVLMGGRSDLQRVKKSELLTILDSFSVRHETSIISSEQNPEELRHYCKQLMEKNVSVVICIAGMIPGLPAAVKAQLPSVPVISVPLSAPGFSVAETMLASFSVPARRPVIMSGIDEVGLRKAAFLTCELISLSSPLLRKKYQDFILEATPKPDLGLVLSEPSEGQRAKPRKAGIAKTPHNGDQGGL